MTCNSSNGVDLMDATVAQHAYAAFAILRAAEAADRTSDVAGGADLVLSAAVKAAVDSAVRAVLTGADQVLNITEFMLGPSGGNPVNAGHEYIANTLTNQLAAAGIDLPIPAVAAANPAILVQIAREVVDTLPAGGFSDLDLNGTNDFEELPDLMNQIEHQSNYGWAEPLNDAAWFFGAAISAIPGTNDLSDNFVVPEISFSCNEPDPGSTPWEEYEFLYNQTPTGNNAIVGFRQIEVPWNIYSNGQLLNSGIHVYYAPIYDFFLVNDNGTSDSADLGGFGSGNSELP